MASHDVAPEKVAYTTEDVEKTESSFSLEAGFVDGGSEHLSRRSIFYRLLQYGVELRGCTPVAPEDRKDTRFFNVFTIFSTSMLSLLP
jgi:hypothetical protein